MVRGDGEGIRHWRNVGCRDGGSGSRRTGGGDRLDVLQQLFHLLRPHLSQPVEAPLLLVLGHEIIGGDV